MNTANRKNVLNGILFGDSNGGGTGGSGDKVSTAPVIVYKTATIEAQGMYTATFTPSITSNAKILGLLGYSVLDSNSEKLQLSLVSAQLSADGKSVEATFFNAMLINLDATTFMATLLISEPGSGGGGIEKIKVQNAEIPIDTADNSVNIPAAITSTTSTQFVLHPLSANGEGLYTIGLNKNGDNGVRLNVYNPSTRENEWEMALINQTYADSLFPQIQTQGDWRYRVYSDGTFEAWYFASGQTITIGDTSGAVYRSVPMSLTLPSNLVSNKTVIPHSYSVNVGHRSYPVWGTIASVSGTTLTYYALSGSTRAATGNHTISAYVTGALE